MNYKHIQLPLSKADAHELKAGEPCLLTGPMFTLRDAGHMRLMDEIKKEGKLPYGLKGQLIFYAGPTPAKAGRPFGAIGPTTASRMDFATPTLLSMGLTGTIGKGTRSEAVHQACEEHSSVYFICTGGAAAYLAKCVTEEEVVAYDDLGTEALRKIMVKDFPVFVGIDAEGRDIYDLED